LQKEDVIMYVTLNFDVEDLYSPEEWGTNDFIKFLADAMHSEGVRGSFLIIGDKLRSLRDRGRSDVIEALARHEIGSHTDRCTHPDFPFDYLAGKGWAEGVAEAYERESSYVGRLEEITGQPACCLSWHGADVANCAPQLIHAAGRIGLPFVYAIFKFAVPSGVARYVNTLTFADWIGGFDRVLNDDAKFEAALRSLDEHIDAIKSVRRHAAIFICHPNHGICPEHVGVEPVANGVNLPESQWLDAIPRFDSPEQIDRTKKNFVRLVRHLKGHPALTLSAYAELTQKFEAQSEELNLDQLLTIAHSADERGRLAPIGPVSACETVMGFAECLQEWKKTGALPERVPRRDPLGPLRDPMRRPCGRTLTPAEIFEAADRAHAFASSLGHLPADLRLTSGRQIGLGAVYLALSRMVNTLAAGKQPSESALPAVIPGVPDEGTEVEMAMRKDALGNAGLADPNLDRETIIKYARLQTWTLKDCCA